MRPVNGSTCVPNSRPDCVNDEQTRLRVPARDSIGREKVKRKNAFKTYDKHRRAQDTNYLADNGIFKANLWVKSCKQSGKGLTFSSYNERTPNNGIAE